MSEWNVSRRKIHSTEDDEEEEIERRRRAKLAAIDVKTIMKQSLIRYPAYKCTKMEERKTIEPTSVGPMAVLESGRQPTGPRLSEHSGGSLSICRVPKPKRDLLVHAHPTQLAISKSRSASRNHSFYSSADTLGGKSPGYAWGYAGSFPRGEESSGYIRNNMRKGLSQERSLQLANGADSPGLGSRRVGKGA
ncbi:hypothetical protein FRC07_001808 [Ceratobasidium sp. 392]|nr:hypothetical protein FRC07_001808 [Ceratobasidium sp. 392]